MRSSRIVALLFFVSLVSIPRVARADSITVGGGLWYEFAYADAGTPAFACDGGCEPSSGGDSIEAGDPAWTFTSSVPTLVTITDAFSSGSSFELFDSGILIGTTPSVDLGDYCGDDPAVCVLDPNMSSGTFALDAGSHSLTIDVNDSPWGGGAAYFLVDPASQSPVPEPPTGTLVVTGILVILCRLPTSRRVTLSRQLMVGHIRMALPTR
jgi:hypothetical protein